jgi:hypothetical protein
VLIKRIALLAMIFMLSLPASALAAEPGSGIIEGQIVNGTEGGGSVADHDITLKTYLNDVEEDPTTTKTDAEGRYVFDGLSTESGYSYELVITFQQAEYHSERLSFGEGETTKSLEITVYDSTTSDEAIKVAMAHTIVYVGEGSLRVMEYALFTNEADRTYILSEEAAAAGKEGTLRFSRPKEATQLQYAMGLMECCLVGNEEVFADTMPVFPGIREVVYSYEVSYNSGEYTFSRNVNYPTARYDLLFQSGSVEATDDRLAVQEPTEIEGTQFKHLSGGGFAPGDTLLVQISDLPENNSQKALLWAALVLAVLVGGSGFFYFLRQRRLQPVSPEYNPEEMRQRLLVELAQLDDDFEGGRIPEEAYRRLRAERKSQLVKLMKRSKEEP